jgi:hypothetical protein
LGVLHQDLSQLEQALSALGELARSVDDPRLSMLTDFAHQRFGDLRGAATDLGDCGDIDDDLRATDLGRCLVRSMQRVRAALNAEVGRVHVADAALVVAARPAHLELACEQLLLAAAAPGDVDAVDVRIRREQDGVILTVVTTVQLGTDTLMRVLPQVSHAFGGDSEGGLTMTAGAVSIRSGQATAVVDAAGTTVTVAAALVGSPLPAASPGTVASPGTAASPGTLGSVDEPHRVG